MALHAVTYGCSSEWFQTIFPQMVFLSRPCGPGFFRLLFIASAAFNKRLRIGVVLDRALSRRAMRDTSIRARDVELVIIS